VIPAGTLRKGTYPQYCRFHENNGRTAAEVVKARFVEPMLLQRTEELPGAQAFCPVEIAARMRDPKGPRASAW
jgi:hypothetical protein